MSQHESLTFDPTQNRGADLEKIFNALHSGHIGTSRPAYAQQGTIWLKKLTGPDRAEIYLYDGSDDIIVGTFNFSTNKFALHSSVLEAFGAAAYLGVGTGVGQVVTVQSGGRLPALDASNLTNVPAPSNIPISSQNRVALLAHTTQGGAGYRSGLVAMADGTLRCWGNGSYSQLGQGSTENHTREQPQPVHGIWLAGTPQKVIAEGYDKWCLMDNGNIWVWGRNNYGELGVGSTAAQQFAKRVTLPSGVGTAVDIAVGSSNKDDGYHCLVLTDSGKILACGNNSAGQVGDGTTTNVSTFVEVGAGNTWAKIFAFGSGARGFSAAITTGGDLYVWGWNGSGNLGLGDTTNRNVPTQNNLFGGASVASMSATEGHQFNSGGVFGAHSAFLLTDGRVYTAGDNRNGQLGTGDNVTRDTPQEITALGSDNAEVLAAGGAPHGVTYVRKSTATDGVFATGWNGYGGLGVGDTTSRNTFTLVNGSTANGGVRKMIVTGNSYYLGFVVIHENDYIYATGYNYYGNLGVGDSTDRNVLTWVPISLQQFRPADICVIGRYSEASYGVLTEHGQYLQPGYGGNGQNGDEDEQGIAIPRLFQF
jgi:alpha-tubulin suppressor-like RCC1 family protein